MGVDTDQKDRIVTVSYTNWKNITTDRHIVPIRIFYGVSSYHPEPQYLLDVFDVDKQEPRVFAMKDIHKWQANG